VIYHLVVLFRFINVYLIVSALVVYSEQIKMTMIMRCGPFAIFRVKNPNPCVSFKPNSNPNWNLNLIPTLTMKIFYRK